jgi:folate-binding Fe-S cluster repair protein YgfZ
VKAQVELTVNHLQGCYIGQETLSKLTNLNAVKQQLWGFVLDAPVGPGSDITDKVSVAL